MNWEKVHFVFRQQLASANTSFISPVRWSIWWIININSLQSLDLRETLEKKKIWQQIVKIRFEEKLNYLKQITWDDSEWGCLTTRWTFIGRCFIRKRHHRWSIIIRRYFTRQWKREDERKKMRGRRGVRRKKMHQWILAKSSHQNNFWC